MSLLHPLDAAQRQELLGLARRSIEAGLRAGQRLPYGSAARSDGLDEPRATFVTLRIHDALRGCCGTMEPQHSLAGDVWRNAWASAFDDPRFPPLTPAEYPQINVHISALSRLELLPSMTEAELLAMLQPGVDGLLLRRGASQATFLPSVWEQVDEPEEFLRHLKQKAGWPAGFWAHDVQVYRYTAESFGERR
jgi:AmmeMemoRadiSam system protein A